MNEEFEKSLNLVKELNFCVFDLETTGGNHKSDKIIEIGLVKVDQLEIVEKKEFLINPQIKIPEFIQKLTSITTADVADSPLIEDVIEEILEFMGDRILVAHNTSFDVPFFNSVLKRLKIPQLENRSLCTNLMTKYMIPNLMNSNLNYMSKVFQIPHHKAHRALDDAVATAHLLINYLKIFADKKISKVNHLYYPRNRYELDRTNIKRGTTSEIIEKKFRQIKTPSLVTLKGKNGVILFSLPFTQTDNEVNLLMEKVNEEDWETITIRLMGPFMESLVHFNTLFNKLEPHTKSEVMKFLWSEHLPGHKPLLKPSPDVTHKEDRPEILGKDFPHFFITNHLVPEQMIIYPIHSLHPKSGLVFRYPSHQKKLQQYISSKHNRMRNQKLRKVHFHPLLKDFIDYYLLEQKENGNDLFFFDGKDIQKKSDEFMKNLNDFSSKHPNSYRYPKDYI